MTVDIPMIGRNIRKQYFLVTSMKPGCFLSVSREQSCYREGFAAVNWMDWYSFIDLTIDPVKGMMQME